MALVRTLQPGISMKLVVFGLSISSSWGNGHATLWRGLLRELSRLGHEVVFFERDVPYYAAHRDMTSFSGAKWVLYRQFDPAVVRAALSDADVGLVTSYCPDAVIATELLGDSKALRVFYDLDTGVTLTRFLAGEPVDYLGPRLLADFHLVLSYTGGTALELLRQRLQATRVAPLYGWVDPEVHFPAASCDDFLADLSYLGTYAEDRQQALQTLFLLPASRMVSRAFIIGGAQYPSDFPREENVRLVPHLTPREHPAFYCSSRLTLNVTRAAMASFGFCPSGRLFEAAACGVPIVSDMWDGLGCFFTPREEIFVARNAEDIITLLDAPDALLASVAERARDRVLSEHTAAHRASELLAQFEKT